MGGQCYRQRNKNKFVRNDYLMISSFYLIVGQLSHFQHDDLLKHSSSLSFVEKENTYQIDLLLLKDFLNSPEKKNHIQMMKYRTQHSIFKLAF